MHSRRSVLQLLAASPLLTAASTLAARPPQALVVGIDEYQMLRPLERAKADAEAVARKLQQLGYECSLVLDARGRDLRAAIGSYVAAIGPETASFVFFAGHGVQVQGANHLLLRDTDATSGQALLSSSLNLADLLGEISAKSPLQSIVVLDACRDSPVSDSVDTATTTISSVTAPNGFYIVYSAGAGQTALDRLSPRDDDPNGVFTRSFVRNLDRSTPFDAIVKRTRVEVADLAASVNHSQHPSIYDQTSSEFTLAGQSYIGEQVVVSGRPAQPARALVIATSRYSSPFLPSLQGPPQDAALIHKLCRENGIPCEVLLNQTDRKIRTALYNLAESEAELILIYYSGHGTADAGDGVLLWDGNERETERMLKRSMRVAELDELFRQKGRTLVILLDTALAPASDGAEAGYLANLGARPEEDYSVAVLGAANYGEEAVDLVEQKAHSPFALALQNAFAQQGSTIEQLAAAVQRDVVGMTSIYAEGPVNAAGTPTRGQTPTLWAGPAARSRVIAEPLSPVRASYQCRSAIRMCQK